MKNFLSLLSILIITQNSFSQAVEHWPASFTNNNVEQLYNKLGGFNNPQFYNVDLNNDVNNDLIIFEASDNTWHSLINENNEWLIDKKSSQYFPEIESWCIILDYNNDTAADIFAYQNHYGQNGVSVYKGAWVNDTLQFTQQFFTANNWPLFLYDAANYPNYLMVSAGDFPAITDVDGDTDIDIVTRGFGGGYFHWYKNTSIENGFGLDTFMFVLEDDCFGKVFDAGASGFQISNDPDSCATIIQKTIHTKHGNSTLKLLDVNYDGLPEMLVADGNATNISLLQNNGSLSNAYFKVLRKQYPAYNKPVQLNYQPAIFEVDVDFDKDKDWLISPQLANAANRKNILFYENLNSADSLSLQFSANNFFVDEMLDFGSGTHPTIVDVNADGLLDVVIGNYGFALESGDRDARLILCLNIGTLTSPKFEVTDEDWLGLSYLTDWYFTPTFCDIDADGDEDLFFGTATGNVYYVENTAAINEPMQFAKPDSAWMKLHSFDFPLGQRAVPNFFDLDKDGLFDLFLGNHRGAINFFKNTGTENEANFNPDPNANENIANFGNVVTTAIGEFTGFAAPYAIAINQVDYLFVATQKLGILQYEIKKINEEFILIEHPKIIEHTIGYDMHLAIAEMDNDTSNIEVITGQHRGGISLYQTNQFSKMLPTNLEQARENNIYSIKYNQQNQSLYIFFEEENNHLIKQINLHTLSGKVLAKYKVSNSKTMKLHIENLHSGMYLLQIKSAYNSSFAKVVLMK